jgi:hypothetical protein
MLPLLFAMILFLFLLIGAVIFLICAAIPAMRRFALSAALWCAIWGPCLIAFMTVAGLALIADAFLGKNGGQVYLQSPRLLSTFGWAYLSAAVLLTAVVASAAAWLHQFLLHRFTFPLFRLYATAVGSGVGSVFGWSLSWWMLAHGVAYTWAWSILGMLLLIAGFGAATFKGAHALRGRTPTKFAWITREEFNPH